MGHLAAAQRLAGDLRRTAGSGASTGLAEAIRAGGIHYRVGGADKAQVLRSVVELMPLPDLVDRQFLLQVLLARESLGSTAVGNGIALPHVRNPVVMHVPRPMVTLCFLERPVEFDALDGSRSIRCSPCSVPRSAPICIRWPGFRSALQQPAFSEVIRRQGSRDEILEACEAVDRSIPVLAGGT